jgi:hypothetical protein
MDGTHKTKFSNFFVIFFPTYVPFHTVGKKPYMKTEDEILDGKVRLTHYVTKTPKMDFIA